MLQATTAAPSSVPGPELVAALEYGLALQQLLQQEFDALREQNLDVFDSLQPENTFEKSLKRFASSPCSIMI